MSLPSVQMMRTGVEVFQVFPAEFSLDYSLESGQSFSWEKANLQGVNAWKGVVNGKKVVAVQYADRLEVRSPLSRAQINEYFSFDSPQFSLSNALKSLAIESENDEVLLTAIKNFPGLRILRQDVWETILSFICSQNSNVDMIKQRIDLLSQRFGNPVEELYSIPSPDVIASAKLRDLLDCKLGYRASYLREASKKVSTGEFDIEKLKAMSFEEARHYLLCLPGVGPKVADCICLFSLGHLNAFPVDTHVFQVLRDFYSAELTTLQGKRKHLKYGDVAFFAGRKFGDYCGYAQQYLFHLHRVAREKLEKVYA